MRVCVCVQGYMHVCLSVYMCACMSVHECAWCIGGGQSSSLSVVCQDNVYLVFKRGSLTSPALTY